MSSIENVYKRNEDVNNEQENDGSMSVVESGVVVEEEK